VSVRSRPTSRWSRPTNRDSHCCRTWLCVASLIAGSVVSPVGGSAPPLGRNGWSWAEAKGKREKWVSWGSTCAGSGNRRRRDQAGAWSARGCQRPTPRGKPGCLDQTMRPATSEDKRDRSKGCQHGGGMGEGRGLKRRGSSSTRHSA
jgi:hypothetical protein